MPDSPAAGPRKAETIYLTAIDLLADSGYDELTMEAVAQRSGVNKTTLYRWWPSKDALLAAALTAAAPLQISIPDTGSFRGDLTALAGEIARLLTADETAAIAAAVLSASASRPALAAAGHQFFSERLERERVIFDRAIARGEVSADIDPGVVIDLLAGALWARLVLRGLAIDPRYIDAIVDVVACGTRCE
ncbi:TetR/AcrR family transcriptional regulator [Nocardia camponoti]|uniref:TetR family transcriptional regulator n=1 Tax=Nocardia camponoti TaxID=1616106 RepID=A0A917QBA9_9NOCA|nr:TetR/AcrR family transcriptional regulator [Nocardia camponoti]GGK40693.1 TetR family transcriptional regulator [Nocardia camponoti]